MSGILTAVSHHFAYDKTMFARTSALIAWSLLITSFAIGDEPLSLAEPQTPIATVLGKPIGPDAIDEKSIRHNNRKLSPEKFAEWQNRSRDKQLVLAICTPLMKAYAERNGLEPTEAELQPQLARVAETQRRIKEKRPDRAAEFDDLNYKKFQRLLAYGAVFEFKVGKALWKQHGGSVGFGSMGSCVAFEGQIAVMREEVEAGRLAFHDGEIEKQFWRAIADKRQLADIVLEDPEEIESHFDSVLQP